MSPTKNTTAGSALVPDLEKMTASVVALHWYWIGTLPACPIEQLWIGSTDFPKMTESVSKDAHSRATNRIPRIGSLRVLTLEQLKRIEADIPYCVIRFTESAEDWDARVQEYVEARARNDGRRKAKVGEGDLTGTLTDLAFPRRKGHPVRIPTDDAVKAAREGKHFPLRGYTPDPRDEPAARYVFAELCDSQTRPLRGEYYPEPLEVTGLKWPAKPTTEKPETE